MRKTAYNEINHIQNALMKILITFNFHIIKSKMHRDFRWEEVCVSVGRYVFDICWRIPFVFAAGHPGAPQSEHSLGLTQFVAHLEWVGQRLHADCSQNRRSLHQTFVTNWPQAVQKIKKCFLSLHQFFLKNKLSKKSYFFSLSFLCKINRENM